MGPRGPRVEEPELRYEPLAPGSVVVEPEDLTVEGHWILHLYTFLHSRDYRVQRVRFPGSDGQEATAYLSLPNGNGRHPVVIAFPILAGSQVVSEGLSKALVDHGYAVLRMQRRPLELDLADGPEPPMTAFRHAIRDARSLLDWLVTLPEIDPDRIAAAGVSLGGILAATLMGVDERIAAGVFIMTGGGLADILHDSSEKPVAAFRERMKRERDLETRAEFIEFMRPYSDPVDPLRYAPALEPEAVLLISGRYDRVIPPERTRDLWEALGQPEWKKFPAGHYQLLPFFWWAASRGADHLDQVLGLSPQ